MFNAQSFAVVTTQKHSTRILLITFWFFSFQELISSLTLYPVMILLKALASLSTWAELYIMVSN